MRICIVSRFPPIEGGIASRTYWQVRRLLDDGHEVVVVTNAGATEPEYRIHGCEEHLRWLSESYPFELHDVGGEAPWHIPAGPDHLERLLNLLLLVLDRSSFDVIESGYLVPYGVAADLASRQTGVPHVLRHGGSDLAKLLPHRQYRELLLRTLRGAQTVISDEYNGPVLRSLVAQVELGPAYEPSPGVFMPMVRSGALAVPVYAYVGKINYHWRRRGLDKIAEWYARQEPGTFMLRVVGQGRGQGDFEQWCANSLGRPVRVEPFVPPWEVPALLSGFDAVFQLSIDDPIQSPSNLATEAQAMGVRLITSEKQLDVVPAAGTR